MFIVRVYWCIKCIWISSRFFLSNIDFWQKNDEKTKNRCLTVQNTKQLDPGAAQFAAENPPVKWANSPSPRTFKGKVYWLDYILAWILCARSMISVRCLSTRSSLLLISLSSSPTCSSSLATHRVTSLSMKICLSTWTSIRHLLMYKR